MQKSSKRYEFLEQIGHVCLVRLQHENRDRGGAQELDLSEIQSFAVEHLHTIEREMDNMWPLETAEMVEE